MSRRLKRLGIGAAIGLVVVMIAAAAPITTIEIGCGRGAVVAPTPAAADIPDPGYRRAEGDSYLTYPEWYIVHAYADLAGVTRQSSESSYDYGASIATFWRSLCRTTAAARAIGPVTADQRITDYIIGLSFTLEMGVQGLYERTIGAATVWTRGDKKTAEDAFNQRFLDDYAAFLQQTPWYRYPFKTELARFWRETPWSFQSPIRGAERRFALSLEYAAKGLYAVAIGALAGVSPADLTIMTIVRGPHAGDVPDVTVVRDLGGGNMLVRTPRYQAYTEILEAWAKNGTSVVEIAGNRRILATVIAREGVRVEAPGLTPIFTIPIQSRPGFERTGFDADIPTLTQAIEAIGRQGATFEHAYDY